MTKIKVLVVDDSALIRNLISRLLEEQGEFQVIGTARNGKEALERIPLLKPDVVTMDVEMPEMDGLAALRRVMRQNPVPVVMLSSHTFAGAKATINALAYGAVDFVPKPAKTSELGKMVSELAIKLKIAARVTIRSMTRQPTASRLTRSTTAFRSGKTDLLVIGSSTGGPAALQTLVPALPKDLPAAVVLVQHFPVGFSQALAESLGRRCRLTVSHAVHGEAVRSGHVLVAPAGMEFTFQGRPGSVTVNLSHGNGPVPVGGFRPSVDVVMTSAAKVYGDRVMGVLLTGMGRDGAQGMAEIKKVKGRTIAQDESTCVVFGMPKEAIKLGAADKISPLPEIPADILNML